MRSSRLLPPVFAGAALLLLFANALPTTLRKHRLQIEQARLREHLEHEQRRAQQIGAALHALRSDAFVVERWTRETWKRPPADAVPLRIFVAGRNR